MRQNRNAGLGEDLVPREQGGLLGNVRIANPRVGCREILRRDRKVLNRGIEPALDRTVIRTGGGDRADRAVNVGQHRLGGGRRRDARSGQADRRDIEVIQGHGQGVARSALEADEHREGVAGTAQQRLAVEFRRRRNPIDFRPQCHKFLIQVRPLRRADRSAGRLRGQFPHPAQQAADGRRGAVGRLGQADAVTGIPGRLIDAADLRPQGFRHAQARRIVGGAGNAQSGRQMFHRFRQGAWLTEGCVARPGTRCWY